MIYGAMPKAHVSKHTYREKSDAANIYVRKYMPSVDRAIVAEKVNKSAMQSELTFNQI
jgi:hypothetical protein